MTVKILKEGYAVGEYSSSIDNSDKYTVTAPPPPNIEDVAEDEEKIDLDDEEKEAKGDFSGVEPDDTLITAHTLENQTSKDDNDHTLAIAKDPDDNTKTLGESFIDKYIKCKNCGAIRSNTDASVCDCGSFEMLPMGEPSVIESALNKHIENFSRFVNNDMLLEVALTKKQRDELPDDVFGIPEERKYPMLDKGHVNDAKRWFYQAKLKYRTKLANKIFDKSEELEMPIHNDGEWFKYLSGDRKKKYIDEYDSKTGLPLKKAVNELVSEKKNPNGIMIGDKWNAIKWIDGKAYRDSVETLIIKDNEIYLYFKDDNMYRVPGGSREPDIDPISMAKNECEEEARITIKDIESTGVVNTIIYSPDNTPKWQKELGKDSINYYGKVTEVFIANYDKKYTGKIDEKDMDNKMLKNGKFYKIESIKDKLLPYHIEALSTRISEISESVIPKITLYHGAPVEYDVLQPIGYDLGNALQKPGWSLFCWNKKNRAESWAIFQAIRQYKKTLSVKDPDLKVYWDVLTYKSCMIKEGYDKIKNLSLSGFAYTIQSDISKVGIGNSGLIDEYTIRDSNIIPTNTEKVIATPSNIDNFIHIMTSDELKKYDTDMMNGKFINSRGILSSMAIREGIINMEAIQSLEDGLKSGELSPGDDIEAYLKKKNIKIKTIKPINRLIKNMNEEVSELPEVKKEMNPVFIVLTQTPTIAGKVIRTVIGGEYNHASISFTPDLSDMYSFNMDGGFVFEGFTKGFFEMKKDECKYAMYVTFFSDVKLNKIKDSLKSIMDNKDKYSYNYMGAAALAFGKNIHNNLSMFCSEFVAYLLNTAEEGFTKMDPSKIAPMQLVNEKMYLLDSNIVSKFNKNNVKNKLKRLMKSAKALKYLTENANYFNNLIYDKDFRLFQAQKKFSFIDLENFYPSLKYPLPFLRGKILGGILEVLPDISTMNTEYLQRQIEMEYESGKNMNNVNVTGVEHIRMAYATQAMFAAIRTGIPIIQRTEDRRTLNRKFALLWQKTVKDYYSKLQSSSDESAKLYYRQALLDLMWNPDEDPEDSEVINNNLINISIYLKTTTMINEDMLDGLDISDANFKNLPDGCYLLPSAQKYPILNKYSLFMALYIFPEMEDVFKEEFISNFNRMYIEFNCDFKIMKSSPYYEYALEEMKEPKDAPIKLNEAQIKEIMNSYIFDIDEDGNIMISEKENSDFNKHYRESLRLLKIYKKANNIEGMKKELCRLFYMSAMIEYYYMDRSKKTDPKVRKEMVNTRALILNSFNQYILIVMKTDEEFDFKDYFMRSPYGNALKINISSIKGFAKILKAIGVILNI